MNSHTLGSLITTKKSAEMKHIDLKYNTIFLIIIGAPMVMVFILLKFPDAFVFFRNIENGIGLLQDHLSAWRHAMPERLHGVIPTTMLLCHFMALISLAVNVRYMYITREHGRRIVGAPLPTRIRFLLLYCFVVYIIYLCGDLIYNAHYRIENMHDILAVHLGIIVFPSLAYVMLLGFARTVIGKYFIY
ncbi:MAG: hypothetical protein HQL51_06360 [Magnetococcales bacterium]|nr:hypothetical protein [Magnetococcales bacterium]